MSLQVRMISNKSLADERERSNRQDAMLTKDEAIAIGMTTALRAGGTKSPKVRQSASYCVSYKLDEDGNKVDAHVFSPNKRKPNRRKMSEADTVELQDKIAQGHHLTAADLAPVFAD